jgi:transposase-like protein
MSKALIGVGRHERTGDRLNYRSGYGERSLDTRLGSLQLRIPKDIFVTRWPTCQSQHTTVAAAMRQAFLQADAKAASRLGDTSPISCAHAGPSSPR